MEIRIAIRELVEFVCRRGSIDNRIVASLSGVDGIRAHQRIQKQYRNEDLAEVPMKMQLEREGAVIKLEGRADGVLSEAEGFVIDEIKLVSKALSRLEEEDHPVHWAQAKIYGYIYCEENSLEGLFVQLTYCHLEEPNCKRFRKYFTYEELARDFNEIIDEYSTWVKLRVEWETHRNESINALEFPFSSYRPGQRELAVRTYKAIENERKCIAAAPTGIGKTISTVFPAVKAMGTGLTEKIFYLTAKTITREAAEKGLNLLREKGLGVRSVTLTAKEKICLMPETQCNPDYCPYANGHFDRVNECMGELLRTEESYDREALTTAAKKHQVCPFELGLDMTNWADVIIGDYNYLFDPRVYLKRFFDAKKTPYTFLIDEAHNLVDRARNMYSAEIEKKRILEVKNSLPKAEKKLRDNLNKINSYFLGIRKNLEDLEYVSRVEEGERSEKYRTEVHPPEELYPHLSRFLELGGDYLDRKRKFGPTDARPESETEDGDLFLEFYFQVYQFMAISAYYDERFRTIYRRKGTDLIAQLNCIDPSQVIENRVKIGKAAIFFSATLLPLEHFIEMFRGKEDDYIIQLDSPFPKENRLLMIHDQIETTYRKRDETLSTVCDSIRGLVESKPGNYMVFLPSYRYMEQAFAYFAGEYPELNPVIQERNMSEEEKESFLEAYTMDREPGVSHVGFCVLGGHFSEGIDLTADRLIGVVIVGVGMPQIGPDRDIVKNYYDENGKDGFEESYVIPGFIKVVQGIGRCIRTEKDRGVLLLMDTRYGQYRYKRLMPYEWRDFLRVRNEEDIKKACGSFWNTGNVVN